MSIPAGTFLPPAADLVAEISFPNILTSRVTILSVEKFAGSAVGTAVVAFRESFATAGQIGYGKEARIRVGNETIFRGTIGSGDIDISSIRDGVEIMLYDDKWGMQANIIGQKDIGPREHADKGFSDVGFEVIFNRDGVPNKKSGEYDFSTGSGAEYWSLADIMHFIFRWYIPESVATVATKELAGYSGIPTNFNAVGMTALQAVDSVAQLAGLSWGLTASQNGSAFVTVKPGGNTKRQALLFAPGAGKSAIEVTSWSAVSVKVRGTVINARDIHYAKSAPAVVETTISSTGTNPVLKRLEDFSDKKFGARFISDVSKYSANGIGTNLSDGAQAKKWYSNLVTRLNDSGTAYLTSSDLAGSGAKKNAPRVEIPVWIQIEDAADTEGGIVKLAVEGYEIDYENGFIDFERTITVLNGNEKKDGKDGKPLKALEKYAISVSDFSKLKVWITVAIVTENPRFAVAGADSTYLPRPFHTLIEKTDLVPEFRVNSTLPDFGSDPDGRTMVAEAEENYIAVDDELQEAAESSLRASAEKETPIRAEFPLFPILEIGDGLTLQGRSLGPTGREAVISIRYNIDGRFTTEVEATNITVGIDPERFIRK